MLISYIISASLFALVFYIGYVVGKLSKDKGEPKTKYVIINGDMTGDKRVIDSFEISDSTRLVIHDISKGVNDVETL